MATALENLSNVLRRRHPGVKNSEIEELRKELQLLNRSMEEADVSMKDEYVKVHAGHMREVANLIEDVLDEYELTGVEIRKLRSRNNLSRNVKKIKELLISVRDKGEQYNMKERVGGAGTSETVIDYRLFVTPISGDEPLVGADVTVKDLTAALLDAGGENRSAVAVLGGGGIGKTALAKKVFSSDTVKERFHIRAWVEVPQGKIVVEEILSRTASQVVINQKFDNRKTKEELVGALKGKRYLIVFDDVWKEQLWHVARDFLPGDVVGSKVMITTRHEAVAASFVETASDCVYRLKRLSEQSSRDLFRSIAFRRSLGVGDELYERSEEIVEMCEGVPLVIRAVAGHLLSKSDQPRELKKLIQSFSLENASLAAPLKIIARGFNDLPQHLRKCFMYFSVFPKESLIHVENLLRFWVAEGFVNKHKIGEYVIEEVAEEYLKELVDRNLVEACEGFFGADRFCRVNNLMHEIVIKEASDRDFCMVGDGESSSFRGKSRRVIISSAEGVEQVSNAVEGYQIRSVFLWNTGPLRNSVLLGLFKRHYLLTMLDIENSGLEVLPKEVGYLLCLNYLSVKNTRVRKLPKTVRKLSKLEVLDLSGSLLAELPMEIAKLGRLRHLLASCGDNDGAALGPAKGVKIKEGIGALANLQTLATVDASHSGLEVIQEMKKLKQLRSLRVSRLTSKLAHALSACISEMKHLKSLHLEALTNETLDLQTVLIPSVGLESLILKGKLQRLPHWIFLLKSLSIICLSLSSLEYDPLSHFADLPELESLLLYGAYQGPRLSFKGGFRKLKLLILREMPGLEAVEIADGAMPLLEELRIGPSPLLKEVPAGIAGLSRLKLLSFYDMPSEFVISVQPDKGSEFSKVQHIPSILFWYKNAAGNGYVSHRPGEPDLQRRLSYGNSDANTAGISRKNLLWPSFSDGENEEDTDSVGTWSDSDSLGETASPSSIPSKKSRRRFSWSDIDIRPGLFKKPRRTSLTNNTMSLANDPPSVYSDDELE